MMKKLLLSAAFTVMLSMTATSASAGGLDLSLSNETANLVVHLDPEQVYDRAGGADISVGVFTNETGDNLLHATLMARGMRQFASGQSNLAAGIKLIGGDLDISESVGALALGFQASLLVAPSEFNPVDFIVEAFYAPGISSFTDAEKFSEVGARLQVEIVPTAHAYLGYRRMIFDTNDFENLTMDRSIHVGIAIRF